MTAATRDPYQRARAKLRDAIAILATGAGDVRWRLQGAYLPLLAASVSPLPDDLRGRLQQVLKRLTRKEPKVKRMGRLAATLQYMQLDTGVTLAKAIVSIEWDLRCASGRQ